MSKSAEAHVFQGDSLAASFSYDEAFLADASKLPVAIHLPRQRAPFVTRGVNLHSFFACLLPEGLRLRALVRICKTSEDDLFSLLIAAGPDTVGDVSVVRAGELPQELRASVDLDRLSEVIFQDVLAESLTYEGRGPEASVPGIQAKVSASMISVPVRGAKKAERFILKLTPTDYPRLAENEAFFMAMARACKIPTASTRLIEDGGGEVALLVRRFDRLARTHQSVPEKIHQEDMCQVLERYPADKYNVELREVFEGLDVCFAPRVERLKLLRQLAFSYVIGNGDLHARNVSVQRHLGRYKLTPAYDLLSTLPYGDQTVALPLEGRDKNWKARDLVAFALRHGVPTAAVQQMLSDLLRRAAPWFERVGEIGLPARKTRQLEKLMKARADALTRF